MSQIEALYHLQQMDTELQTKKQRLGEVIKLQKYNHAFEAAKERAEKADTTLRDVKTRQSDAALELAALIEKITRSEKRLYSGAVKNPKELSDLQNEVTSLGRRRGLMEERELEIMIELEEAESENTAAQEELLLVGAEWEETQAALQTEQRELALRLYALTSQRGEQLKVVAPDMLKKYQQVAQKKNGLAVVHLQDSRCTGCQLDLSSQVIKSAQHGQFVKCPHCGRILHV